MLVVSLAYRPCLAQNPLAPRFLYNFHTDLRQRASHCIMNAASATIDHGERVLPTRTACFIWRALREASERTATSISLSFSLLEQLEQELGLVNATDDADRHLEGSERVEEVTSRLAGEVKAANACAAALWAMARAVPEAPLLSQLALSHPLLPSPSHATSSSSHSSLSPTTSAKTAAVSAISALDAKMARITCTAICAAQLRPLLR